MPTNNDAFKQGLKRGKEGKSNAQDLLDVILDSNSEKAARCRGYEVGVSAKAIAEASKKQISASHSSGNTYDGGPDLLLRKWFPDLLPWSEKSEDDAFFLLFKVLAFLITVSSFLFGLYYGYVQSGIGAAIVVGLILGVVGYIAGTILSFLGVMIIYMLINAATVLIPISIVFWLISLIWGLKF